MIQKEALNIREMFNSVAANYDLVNDVLSFGSHHLWKRELIRAIPKGKPCVLDCATGTGDIAILIKKKTPKAEVIGVDFSERMLEQAPQKAEHMGLKGIKFLVGDILKLPFGEENFDHVTISFGIRNVENLGLAIAELKRVLKTRGVLHVLEFGQAQGRFWPRIYGAYHRKILPFVGGLLSGNRKAYTYLNESSEAFPSGPAFTKEFSNHEWRVLESKPLLGGVAYIYRLQKI